MTRALLDVNVLLALLDVDHVHHEVARSWLTDQDDPQWASCAVTQNGYVRIVSQSSYPGGTTPESASTRLGRACAGEHHQFWSCDISLLDTKRIDRTRVLGPKQVTDVYLLALAVAHGGRFVTLDTAIDTSAVRGAAKSALVTL